MLSIEKIHCEKIGSSFRYDLDTNLFNENIFKMCTVCGKFSHDISEIFCECGSKLSFVDISDPEILLKWLNLPNIKEVVEEIVEEIVEEKNEEKNEKSSIDDEGKLMSVLHDCGADSTDCIDCNEKRWEDSDYDSDAKYKNVAYSDSDSDSEYDDKKDEWDVDSLG